MKQMILAGMLAVSATALAQTENKDEQAIRSIATTMETGWNTKSGQAFSSAFAEKHDYIVVNGLYFPNWSKQGNAAAHQNLFDGIYKNENLKMKVDKIQFLRSDLAQVTAFALLYPKNAPIPEDLTAIMTILVEKKDSEWKIISFHNHGLDSSVKQGPMPMKVMYASWYQQ
ncbi:MAG: SgcJ/EcaC family oxidoreductase [Flavisolibacter sp.]